MKRFMTLLAAMASLAVMAPVSSEAHGHGGGGFHGGRGFSHGYSHSGWGHPGHGSWGHSPGWYRPGPPYGNAWGYYQHHPRYTGYSYGPRPVYHRRWPGFLGWLFGY